MNSRRKRPAIINNMVSMIISPEAMGTSERFNAEMEAFIAWAKSPPPGREPTVQIAGEPELATRAARLVHGIPVDPTTWEQILASGEAVGLDRSRLSAVAGLS